MKALTLSNIGVLSPGIEIREYGQSHKSQRIYVNESPDLYIPFGNSDLSNGRIQLCRKNMPEVLNHKIYNVSIIRNASTSLNIPMIGPGIKTDNKLLLFTKDIVEYWGFGIIEVWDYDGDYLLIIPPQRTIVIQNNYEEEIKIINLVPENTASYSFLRTRSKVYSIIGK